MAKDFPINKKGFNPFGELIGLNFISVENGNSECMIEINEQLMNPQQVVHGAVIYAIADTGMGAAIYSQIEDNELCATIEIKIEYFKAAKEGVLKGITKVVHKGKNIAFLESEIVNNDQVIAKACGTFSIFKKKA